MSGIEMAGATRVFAGGAGVRGIDLEVREGRIHALVGLNGAGKSTLMRLLLGMLAPQSGSVRIAGFDPRQAGTALGPLVGHLIEYPLAYGELTGRANLELGARLHGVRASRIRETVDGVLDELGLARYAEVRARRMSLGNRQRLGLASALQHDPRVVVLDEPTNALDPAGVILLREALLRRAAAGAAVLVSSHHLDEVARIADDITVINAGRVIGSLPPGERDLEHTFFELVRADDLNREEVPV
ncbi:ABC transporter ATP-binding protein [Homoserinibacter sp. GY 40078]|uniref:ABC transporter ATP-binding protein n=1 Tax=Homoserinibacter sp. GY 40078 TaxID=2603275 RepID=UPI0011CA906B|nr:ABC transporter ATP-binding protein [Homoserinibacter sp. GY 40078]TXK17037.1 ABC transporter ATP-binding protein [Homoserinibacter sp. GY 40078]